MISEGQKTILVLENEHPENLPFDQVNSLQKQGYRVISADSAEKALEAVQVNPEIGLVLVSTEFKDRPGDAMIIQKILSVMDVPVLFCLGRSPEAEAVANVLISPMADHTWSFPEGSLLASIDAAFKAGKENLEAKENFALRAEIENQVNQMGDMLPIAMIAVDQDYNISYLNPVAREIFGLAALEDQEIRDGLRLLASDDRVVAAYCMQTLLEGEEITTPELECRGLHSDGFEIDLKLRMSRLELGGKTIGFRWVFWENNVKGKAVETRSEEERWGTFVNSATDALVVFDSDLNILDMNEMNMRMFHPGQSRNDIIGKNLEDVVPNLRQSGRYDQFMEVIRTGKPFFMEDIVPHPKFGAIALSVKAFRLGEGLGTITRDITDRKLAERRIHSLLHEKELLLKEVHHRVKNNMAVIRSLLSLQSNMNEDPIVVQTFKGAIRRIDSMILLYEKLYVTEQYSEVSTKEYLSQLIDEILALYPGIKSIRIDKEIEDIPLRSEQVFPLGIIVNELLSNAMKHAFADRAAGQIRIRFERRDDRAAVIFEDNGVGMGDEVQEGSQRGFGLKLIELLTQQMGGDYRIEGEKGTRFHFEFDI